MGTVSKFEALNRRLDSWKEIASFFGCDERTVKRWEKERGLPVHRLPGVGRGKVFAYSEELSDWLRGTGPKPAESLGIPEPGNGAPAEPRTPDGHAPQEASPAPYEPILGHPAVPGISKVWFFALAILALILVALLVRPHAPAIGQVTAAHRPANPEAEDLYLEGRFYWNQRTADSLNQAVDYFTQAIVHDPNYAPAYVGLADCYNLLREFAAMPDKEAYPRALAAAKKAVELDDTLAEAHRSLAFGSYYWNWDAATAEREYQRAIELTPNDATAHQWHGNALSMQGSAAEALSELERARKLDSSSRSILADYGSALFGTGQVQQSLDLLKQMETSDPEFISPHTYLAWIYWRRRDFPDYFEESGKIAALRHDPDALALAEAEQESLATGGEPALLQTMAQMQEKMFRENHGRAYPVAAAYAMLGKKQEALRYLQLALDRREVEMLLLSRDLDFSGLRADPAFRDVLAKVRPREL